MDDITFAVVIHHGGKINSSKRPHYAGGKATQVCENLDIDRLSYPEIMSYVKEDLGYDLDSIIGLYYFKNGEFVLVQDDRTVLEIANKLGSGVKLDFYVEHMSSHSDPSNLIPHSTKGCYISQGVKKVVGEATRGPHNMVHAFSENIIGDLDDETDMGFFIDDEEEELQQSLDNVRAFERENMHCWNENELNGVDDNQRLTLVSENEIFSHAQVIEDDVIYSSGSESDNNSSCSFYIDSDDNCSYYSETDEECGDRALRRLSKIIRFDPKATIPIFCCGMVFLNIEECRHALAKYAIMKGVQVHFIKNDKIRVRAGCMEKCPWKFYASKDGDSDNFVVKTYIPNHKCHRKNSNKLATSKYLAKHLRERLMATPYIKARELKELCKIELKLRISMTQARNVRGKLLESLIGSYTEEYKRLHDYVHEINSSNPGTTCVVKASTDEVGDLNYFRGFYVCFAACKRGWLEGCRKIIGVDGCFLKGISKGQLLCAIGRDGNDQMFPIAWAVVAVENKENWGWFLNLLKHDLSLEDGTNLTIISDMQKVSSFISFF